MAEKMINCKACGKEIAKSAATCPHCGKRNKRPWWQIALIALGILVVLSVIGNMGSKRPNSEISSAASAAADTTSPSSSSPGKTNPGIWALGNVLDNFGESTSEKYIAPKDIIRGTFSNVATANSQLDVQLYYTDKNGLMMQLFEYGKQLGSPATGIGVEKISISIQAGDGERYTFPGYMTQSWLFFDQSDRETTRDILAAGGTVKFRIKIDTLGVISDYSFDIQKADGFNIVYEQYTGL
jgi:RNA polymerase subunit RPABC4/transcription elongation factor Spt4